jgi:hypothetical protein
MEKETTHTRFSHVEEGFGMREYSFGFIQNKIIGGLMLDL